MNVSILNFHLFLKFPEVFIQKAVVYDLHVLQRSSRIRITFLTKQEKLKMVLKTF